MPRHDLSKLWEEHTADEFVTRDTEATLATMTDDAYVNHIPVMTGGCGKAAPPPADVTQRQAEQLEMADPFVGDLLRGPLTDHIPNPGYQCRDQCE